MTRMEASIDSGLAGATVRMIIVVEESDVRPKRIIWANEMGHDEGEALSRAQEKMNVQLAKVRGDVVGFYSKFITPPLPKRTYATLVVAVNGEVPKEVGRLSSEERRGRLAAVLRLLGNDPKAINITRAAKTLGVSRDTVYKDLQELGVGR